MGLLSSVRAVSKRVSSKAARRPASVWRGMGKRGSVCKWDLRCGLVSIGALKHWGTVSQDTLMGQALCARTLQGGKMHSTRGAGLWTARTKRGNSEERAEKDRVKSAKSGKRAEWREFIQQKVGGGSEERKESKQWGARVWRVSKQGTRCLRLRRSGRRASAKEQRRECTFGCMHGVRAHVQRLPQRDKGR